MLMTLTLIFSAVVGFILALIPHLVWVLVWIICQFFGYSLPYAPFGWTALGLVICFSLLMLYGYFVGRWRLEVNEVTISQPMLPKSFNGFKIVHISDLHLSTFEGHPEKLQRIVDTINAQEPDLICFTGDLVTMSKAEAEPFTDLLRQLRAKNGVTSVLGNHDFFIYNRSFADSVAHVNAIKELKRYECSKLGWRLLNNSHQFIRRGRNFIAIIGVDNIHGNDQGFSTVNAGDLGKAMEETDDCYRILLTHDPSHWEAEVLHHTNIPLTLSGHTHSAQVRLFGWNPASLMFRQSWGKYTIDGQTLYVNAGLGCTLPVRLNCPAEITVITLQQ